MDERLLGALQFLAIFVLSMQYIGLFIICMTGAIDAFVDTKKQFVISFIPFVPFVYVCRFLASHFCKSVKNQWKDLK